MLALPVPPFTLQKCYRELIRRVLKEAHKRWKHRNTQLSQSGDLVDHVWTPSTRTFKAPPTSPRKRKRDIQWSTNRLTETRMQHILHDYTHTQHPSLIQGTSHTDTDPGEDSGRNNNIEEVGISEGGAEVGRSGGTEGFLQDSRGSSSGTGLGREFSGSGGVGARWGEGRGGKRGLSVSGGRRSSDIGVCVSCTLYQSVWF